MKKQLIYKFSSVMLIVVLALVTMPVKAIQAKPLAALNSVTVGAQTGSLFQGTGGSVTYNIAVIKGGGGTASVTLAVSGLPAGVTGVFSGGANPFNQSNNSTVNRTLTITTLNSTPANTYTFTVTASGQGTVTGNGTLTVILPDTTPPTLTSFTRQNPATSPTNANSLTFRATFNEGVQNVNAADFAVTGTTATITNVNTVNSSTYDVTVSGGNLNNLNGTVGLNLAGGQNITDLAGNALPNGEPTTDQTYLVDNTAPTAISFIRQNPATNPTNANSLTFRVTFNEDVQNVDTDDFDATGTSAGVTSVVAVTANSVYDVTISGGNLSNYNGTAGLDFDISGGGQQNIEDTAGNNLPSAQPTTQETYTVDNNAPTLTITQAAGQIDPTSTLPISFQATFNEAINTGSFTGTDITFGGTAPGVKTATITEIAPNNGTTFNVAVNGVTGFGTVTISISAGTFQDLAGNNNTAASTNTDNSVTYAAPDTTAPTLVSFTRQNPATNPTNDNNLVFRATFNEGAQNVTAGDFTVSGTTANITVAMVGVNPSLYDITISGGDLNDLNGTVDLNLAAGQNITDLSGNALPNGEPTTDQTYLVDNTAPTAISFTRQNPATNPTNANSLTFRVTFNEDVQNVTTGDFDATGTTAGVTSVVVVTASSVYDVTISGGNLATLNGTVGLDFDISGGGQQDIEDLAGNNLPSAQPATQETYTVDNFAPFVTINQAGGGQTDPTSISPINFTVIFTEAVTGFATGDVTLAGTAGGTLTGTVTGGPQTFTVAVTGMTTSGTVIATIGAGAATDLAGNNNNASISIDNTVTYVAQVNTTTAVNCVSNPVSVFAGTTCTATVTRASGTNTPGGTVTWNTDGAGGFTPLNICTLAGSGAFTTCSVTYTPSAVGSGSHTITASYGGDTNFLTSNGNQAVTVDKATPVITWSNPADIVYGTALSGTQLNASTPVAGTFTYAPPSGTVLNAGAGQVLSVDFAPTDTANFNNVNNTTVTINVLKATPIITWANPADIFYGTALSGTQLNASTPVAGIFTYTPPSGTILNAGAGQVLSVDFASTDANYNDVNDTTVTINVLKATPTVSVTGGTFTYDGAAHGATGFAYGVGGVIDVLAPAVTFTYTGSGSTTYGPTATAPTDTGTYDVLASFAGNSDYNPASNTDTITINKATPVITWANPADIVYGTALSGTQLNASTPVAGTFTYTPPSGTVLNAGAGQVLSVDFAPTDTANFNNVNGTTVTINVLKATPTVSITGDTFTYDGAAHGATGFAYGVGGVIDVLAPAVTFTYTGSGSTTYGPTATAPTDTGTYDVLASFAGNSDYNPASNTNTITINKATPVITWANPADIVYGTALSGTQLNASTPVAGTFIYIPPSGTILNAGAGQVLSVDFAPTDTANFNPVNGTTVTINVLKATPTVSVTGGTFTYDGAAHGATGFAYGVGGVIDVLVPAVTFTYTGSGSTTYGPTPTAPTNAGTYDVLVSFAGNSDYNPASNTNTITINKATPVITWANPADIVYGTALSGTQLNASTPVAGTFTYTPPSGTVLNAGAGQVLSVDFAPTDTANFNNVNGTTVTINVLKADQSITITSTAPVSAVVGGATYTPTATGGASGNLVVFTIDATAASVCSISGGDISFQTVGTCVANANQAGNINYNDAPQIQQSFAVGQGSQTITFTSPAPVGAVVGGAVYTPTATGGASVNPVILTIDASSSSVCSISGGDVSFQTVGTCLVNANQAGDTNYTAAPQVQQSFVVGQGSQTITFTSPAPASAVVAGATYTPTATGGASINPVVLTVDAVAASVCSISGGDISFQTVGTCVVNANQAGDTNYTAAPQVQQSFVVGKGTPLITWATPADIVYGTALSNAEQNVIASVTGTFTYTPAFGAVLNAGAGQILSVDFVPTDTTNYNPVNGTTVTINVLKATPNLSVTNSPVKYTGLPQAAIVIGSVPGVVSNILHDSSATAPTLEGTYAVTADFAPTDAANYTNLTVASAGNFVIKSNDYPSFLDVPTDYWAWQYIEAIYAVGITGGCGTSPLIYCPAEPVTRAQMAIFLLRGIHGKYYAPPPATGTVFTDVPLDYWAAGWVEQLALEGITGGCGDAIYCPDAPITRAQMAIFLLRTKYGSDYVPPTATGTLFIDVPLDYWAADWVEQLFQEDITRGCGDGNFCPDADVTRDQMAVFLQRLFGFPLP